MDLPERRKELEGFNEDVGISVDVLVRLKTFHDIMIGRYIHGIGEWQVDGVHGTTNNVIEWWPFPEFGTGNKVGN